MFLSDHLPIQHEVFMIDIQYYDIIIVVWANGFCKFQSRIRFVIVHMFITCMVVNSIGVYQR